MLSLGHLIVILLILLLLFGAGKLPSVMADLAKGIKSFKKNLDSEDFSKNLENLEVDNNTNLATKHNNSISIIKDVTEVSNISEDKSGNIDNIIETNNLTNGNSSDTSILDHENLHSEVSGKKLANKNLLKSAKSTSKKTLTNKSATKVKIKDNKSPKKAAKSLVSSKSSKKDLSKIQ